MSWRVAARACWLGLLPGLVITGCHRASPGHADGEFVAASTGGGAIVDPGDYHAFYLWPGVTPSPRLNPTLLYLLDGEIRRDSPARFTRLRWGTPHLAHTPLWLVVRADRLDWGADLYATLFDELDRWHRAGNEVVGLQVDFDAATRGIGGYRAFLTGLRTRLPARWRLSITGLLDWSAHGNPRELFALHRTIDEVVIQTYQGRTTIPGYEAYFRRMHGFPIPFRVALAQGGAWAAPPMLAREAAFRGYVIFLQRPRRSF